MTDKLPSKTFCILPFIHLATHPHGGVTLCCESDPTLALNQSRNGKKFLRLGDDSIDDIMNSEYFSDVRLKMLAGEVPDACKLCYKKEAEGISSKRTRDNAIYEKHIKDARSTINEDGTLKSTNLRFLELRLGNVCNVKCRSCNPASSSRWMDDHLALKPKLPFLKFAYETIDPIGYKWPESESFWEELIDVTQEVEQIYINGGEPTLIKRHWKFLQDLVDTGRAENIMLWYSINMTRLPEKDIQVWKHFKEVRISASIDDIEDRNHYIRYPTEWADVLESIDTLKRNNTEWDVMQTISIMNIYYLPEMWNWVKQYGVNYSYNYVNEPEHLNCRYIPRVIKDRILDRLKGKVPKDKFIEVQNLFKDNSDPDNIHWAEFCKFTSEMDKLRGQSFKDTFREFYDLLIECEIEVP